MTQLPHSVLYVGENTAVVEFYDVKDYLDVPQADATVTLTALINKATGNAVTGLSLPLSMPYVPADQLYRGVLPPTLVVVAGGIYLATIKATGSQGFKAEFVETLVARVRAA